MKATWNNTVIAESDNAIEEEGYYYFPLETVHMELLKPSRDTSSCYLKGTANYYHIKVRSKRLANGAWTYHYPSDAASLVRNRIAFGDEVKIEAD
jgi:uncharacterized protein (DUF427 family)